MKKRSLFVAGVTAALAACSADEATKQVPLTSIDTPQTSTELPGSARLTTPSADVPAACNSTVGPRVFQASIAEVQAAYQGRWVRCNTTGLTDDTQAGIEFVGDHWQSLGRDAAGALEPMQGSEAAGTLAVLDESADHPQPTFQVNLATDTHVRITPPLFTADSMFVLENNGDPIRYVRETATPAADPIADRPSATATIPEACNAPVGPEIVHSTVEDVRIALQGKWVLCSDKGLSHSPQAGIEFDGERWHGLQRDAAGELVSVPSLLTDGTANLLDLSGVVQANLDLDRGGTVSARPVFTADSMLIDNNAVWQYRYVRVP